LGNVFFCFEICFSSFEALPLFRQCAEIAFQDSFLFYCECVDYCVDYPSSDNDLEILLNHFSSNTIQQSDLNSRFAANFQKPSAENDLNSLFILGLCLFYGFGVNKSINLCVQYFWISSLMNHPLACYFITLDYRFQILIEYFHGNKIFFWTKAAQLGCLPAMFEIGNYYFLSYENEENFELGIFWYHEAAELGQIDAMYNLGICFYRGEGIEQNFQLAVFWFQKAAELGQIDAMLDLGLCFYKGEGIERNFQLTVFWFQKAAELDQIDAMFNLGISFKRGEGIKQNLKLAVF
jgi:TPR repeat protein